jgi:hypothetical protein
MPQSSLQSVIRGTLLRELRASPEKKRAIRRIRARLIAIYVTRFGQDVFEGKILKTVIPRHARDFWLERGYAYWRNRLTLNSTVTPDGTRQ